MKTINGTYGSGKTPCSIFEHDGWYCVEGSKIVNLASCEIGEGVDVETIPDLDCFTWSDEINSEDELLEAIEA